LARKFLTFRHLPVVVLEFDERLRYTIVVTEVFVALPLTRPHPAVMFVYDTNRSVAKRVFDFLSHDVLDVCQRVASDLKEAVNRIVFKLGKPFSCIVTKASRSSELAIFESFVFGIGVIEEFTKTLLGEGDIDTG
jgi:hypothetical protein